MKPSSRCVTCGYAEWERAPNGRLTADGRGKCTLLVDVPAPYEPDRPFSALHSIWRRDPECGRRCRCYVAEKETVQLAMEEGR